MNLNDAGNYIKGIRKKVVTTVKKVLAGLFGFLGIGFAGLCLLFIFITFPIKLFGLGIFFGFLSVFSLVMVILMLKSSIPAELKKHYDDIEACRSILEKIQIFMKNESIRREFRDIIKRLNKELGNAKIIAHKIDGIVKTMMGPEWDIGEVTVKLSTEERKTPRDERIIEKLKEQKNNILILQQRENTLRQQLTELRQDFNSIYTKLTLLDTTDKVGFDKIETEIQKILDHKLKVSRFEEQLDKELS